MTLDGHLRERPTGRAGGAHARAAGQAAGGGYPGQGGKAAGAPGAGRCMGRWRTGGPEAVRITVSHQTTCRRRCGRQSSERALKLTYSTVPDTVQYPSTRIWRLLYVRGHGVLYLQRLQARATKNYAFTAHILPRGLPCCACGTHSLYPCRYRGRDESAPLPSTTLSHPTSTA